MAAIQKTGFGYFNDVVSLDNNAIRLLCICPIRILALLRMGTQVLRNSYSYSGFAKRVLDDFLRPSTSPSTSPNSSTSTSTNLMGVGVQRDV
jgi:hypothetical protein